MRLTNVILGLALGGMATALGAMGCSGGSGGSGGGTNSSSSSGSSSASGAASTCPDVCCPTDPACVALKVKSQCLGLVDNAMQPKFALRMSQLDIKTPVGLTTNLVVKQVIANGVTMNYDKCNLGGGGTFNLIMQFDTAAKTLTVGGAHPATDPSKGYTFVNEMDQGIQIAPVMSPFTIDATGKFTPMNGLDIVLPIYLAATDAKPSVLLPLHKSTIIGTLTADNNCIGSFNGKTLKPANGCAGTDADPAFTANADLAGFMTLEEADKVIVSTIHQSLCVLISGDAATYGMMDANMDTVCKRDASNKITFKGDWCSTTNMAADAMCYDAASLTGALAASSVMLNP